ncbi:putative aminoglycoside phosphotransferase protein [Venturia nashicola]|uniref:Putative aminoglycoside phosphotransferase protein n=1 Tax=Venturia nashicola TaxID=86259 RepID=A0A4Z1PC81_9PEZI|nr:putative aminoglycoside phosphotransferase protein [Venturia nashicola]TLD38879.1 putative aminoglycoside phosphotransferase protein [Venturia nashicola]
MISSNIKLLSREPSSNAAISRSQPAGSTNSSGADARGWKAKFIHAAAKAPVKVLRHYDPFLTPSTHSLTPSSPWSTTSSPATSKSSIEDLEDEKANWGPTKDIDPVLICRLVKRLLGHEYGDRCWLQEKHAGTFNQVYVVMFDDGADGIKIVIKVPATGWAPRWCEQDAVYLRSEAPTLRYIHQKCDDAPFVPQMLAYDTTFDNEINAPFILMTHLKGRPA